MLKRVLSVMLLCLVVFIIGCGDDDGDKRETIAGYWYMVADHVAGVLNIDKTGDSLSGSAISESGSLSGTQIGEVVSFTLDYWTQADGLDYRYTLECSGTFASTSMSGTYSGKVFHVSLAGSNIYDHVTGAWSTRYATDEEINAYAASN